jgi:hypothetical protein
MSYNKYGNVRTLYNGFLYSSKKEARYAQELDLRVRAKDIKSWERQIPFPMIINGIIVCKYVVDFVEEDMNGKKTCIEIKGRETDVWKLKYKLFKALYPTHTLQVIK